MTVRLSPAHSVAVPTSSAWAARVPRASVLARAGAVESHPLMSPQAHGPHADTSTQHALATALRPPDVPQPPSSAHAQREAIWRELQRTAYSVRADAEHTVEDPYGLFGNTQAHRLDQKIDGRAQEILSLPLWMGFAGMMRGAESGRQMMERFGELAGNKELLVRFGEAAGGVYGALLLGAAGTLSLPLVAAAYAALDTKTLVQRMLKTPRALTAKVTWKPSARGPYGGLLGGGAPALFSVIDSRLGPMLRLQVFVDGQEPITLTTRENMGAEVGRRLAHVQPNGKPAWGASPERIWWQVWDFFGGAQRADWREAAMKTVKPGTELMYLHEGHMGGGVDDGLGHIVAETAFVASEYGDSTL